MTEGQDLIVESEEDLDRLIFGEAPQCIARPFEDICDYIEQRSLTFRLFRNELGDENKKRIRKNDKATILAKKGRPAKNYFVPLPKNRSSFTIQEMKDLFAVYSTNGTNKIPTSSQIKFYSASIEKIQKEKEEFSKIVHQRWLQESWTRTSSLKPEIDEFVSLWWEGRINRVKRYPSLYAKMSSISLTPSTIDEIALKFVAKLGTFGSVERYINNPRSHDSRLTLEALEDLIDFERTKQASTNSELTHYLKEVSQDELATKLALENNAQIVTTPSVILNILAHNPLTFEESWSIPIIVKDCNQGEHTSKIIFMEKKLAPKSLSSVDKNNIFAKYATRNLFTKKNLSVPAEAPVDEMKSTNSSTVDEISPQTNKRVDYNLWECAPLDAHSVLSKHHHKTFKLLIRTSTKGVSVNKHGKDCPYVTLSKLEFQPEYGAEVVSFKEVMREWLSVTLRPDSILHRVRVDPMRGETVMTEIKTATDLANDCIRLHSRGVHHQLSVLQTVLETVTGLPPGSYLLDHQLGDKGFMFLYHQQTNSKSHGAINLREAYNSIDVKSTSSHNAAWIPIDSTVITPTLEYFSWIPCALPPTIGKEKTRVVREIIPKKKKKKKNKKRKMAKMNETSIKEDSTEQL